MKKGEKFKRIEISKEEYKNLEKQEIKITSAKLLRRLQMLKFIHMGWNYGRIANFLNVRQATITSWANTYKKEGISELLKLNYRGRIHKLNNNQLAELKEMSRQGKFKFAKEIKDYIQKQFNLSYHLNHVQKLAKKNFGYPLSEQN